MAKEKCPYCEQYAVEERYYCPNCGTVAKSQTKRALFLGGQLVCRSCSANVQSEGKKVCGNCGKTVEDKTLSMSDAVGSMTSSKNQEYW